MQGVLKHTLDNFAFKQLFLCTGQKINALMHAREPMLMVHGHGFKKGVSGLGLDDGEMRVVVTDNLIEPFLIYEKHWEIVCLFACIKSKGFNFENTHITKLDRIEKLLALLTIAFCWAYKTGEWRNEQKENQNQKT